MSAAGLLLEAEAAGVHLSLNGTKLRVDGTAKPPEALLAKFRDHKAEIVSHLAAKASFPISTLTTLTDQAVERARILEADAGLSRSDADRQAFGEAAAQLPDIPPKLVTTVGDWVLAGCPITDALAALSLQGMDPPRDWPPPRQCAFQGDALRFAETWAEKAAATGWEAWELWGCHRRAPFRRINGLGLVPIIGGALLTGIDEREAIITSLRGHGLRYRRKLVDPLSPVERAMIWEVTAKEAIC